MQRRAVMGTLYLGAVTGFCLVLSSCVTTTVPQKPEPLPANQVGRPVLAEAAEALSLQSSVMALADTSIIRVIQEMAYGTKIADAELRRDDAVARVALGSALVAIATEPDAVDALVDLLTHVTLTADAQRNAARGKAPDSTEARLLAALEQNEKDAWKLAERWLNEPTRAALKARIMAWPGRRDAAAGVAFVRLSDIPRGGAESVTAGEGMFDSLRAATSQADQFRLLAERAVFLVQRLPFLLRWQMEVYTANTLASEEALRGQAQIDQITAVSVSVSKTLAGLADRLSVERAAALDDVFGHIREERKDTVEQITLVLQQERTATLAEVAAAIDAQRKAVLSDVVQLVGVADTTSKAWIGRALLVGIILIAVFLVGLLGTMLLYRRFAPVVEQRASRAHQ